MSRPKRYVIRDREQSSLAEAFRALRPRLQTTPGGITMKTILFTSASQGEGGAMTAVNSAATLAYAGKKVILVDCDLRTPILHDVFRLQKIGITNVIKQEALLEDTLQSSGISNLMVLTSGPLPQKPLEMLSGERLKAIIENLKAMADCVIINSSPLKVTYDAIVSDACVLASKVDGVVLVVDKGKVRVQSAKKALALLKSAKAHVIGTILNGVEPDEDFVY